MPVAIDSFYNKPLDSKFSRYHNCDKAKIATAQRSVYNSFGCLLSPGDCTLQHFIYQALQFLCL